MLMSCVFLDALRSIEEHIVNTTKDKPDLTASFFASYPVLGPLIHKGHFPLIEKHFLQGTAGCKVDNEGTFLLKYLPSRFDKSGCPR